MLGILNVFQTDQAHDILSKYIGIVIALFLALTMPFILPLFAEKSRQGIIYPTCVSLCSKFL